MQTLEIISPGLLATSVGGGGGTGGGAFSAAVGQASMAVAVGGTGGSGGAGGVVGVNCGEANSHSSSSAACTNAPGTPAKISGAMILTEGTISPGIMAVSIGGGGGTGGFSVALAAGSNMAASVSVGGKGGSGGAGGAVYANSNGVQIATNGEFSTGIEALSVGGGGGHGGVTMYTPDYLPGGAVAPVSASISVGGAGGNGGAGGAVIAENIGAQIQTTGDRANGIFAGSIGGRGGHGGLAAGGAVGVSLSISTSVGGPGGSGNSGGAVTVYNTSGKIETFGNDAHAIEAMSIGGGGGSGGWSAGAGVSLGSATSFTVGGNGGTGGNGGAVAVNNSGILRTNGVGGAGLIALSVGGGGGNGGSSASSDVAINGAFTSTVGGSGAGGATGGSVSVINSANILTGLSYATNPSLAIGAQGIVAMSIGGGGGRGGIAATGNLTGSGSLSDTVGGGSGNGGTGGAVSVTNQGQIASLGNLSNAIVAISTGGRGGLGGIAVGGSVSNGNSLNETIGSPGGNGGHGGDVDVSNAGVITTGGIRAIGISAQSIGGNGGVGGIAVGSTISAPSDPSSTLTLGGAGGHGGVGGAVSILNNAGASVSSTGPFSAGLVAQSVGGDGGIGGIGIGVTTSIISPSMTLGGSGGSGALGGAATITSAGSVVTGGLNSLGMLAQSIGGNGGFSGFTVAGASSDRAGQFGMNLGNSGGSGATGGAATISVSGPVTTSGILSTGVAAQSIGGGGGRAGATVYLDVGNATNTQLASSNANLGASGGGGGNGGAVALTQLGSVSTSGYQSEALYAQSIGGGGGSSGLSFLNMTSGTKNINLSVGGLGGSDGAGGAVTMLANQSAAPSTSNLISTAGIFSEAVYAQSIGGGGGSASAMHAQLTAAGTVQSLMRLGSTGGSGGDGGTLEMATGGAISAQGFGSTAVFGQSIGGGGGRVLSGLFASETTISIPSTNIQFTVGSGSASSSNGSSGSSTSSPSTTLSLTSATSTTITAGSAGSAQLGGFATSNGDGGAISLASAGQISTSSVMSDGIKLQSIGGGGGFSGTGDVRSGSPFAASTMSLGGGSSGGGNGSSVNLTNNAVINTGNSGSLGVLSQSVGGGGGDARYVSLANLGLTSAFVVSQGAQLNAFGGSGGAINLTNNAVIQTTGIGSDAIAAQSIGGGGGFSIFYGASPTPPTFALTAIQTASQSSAGAMSSATVGSGNSAAYAGTSSSNASSGGSVSTVLGASMAAVLGASGGGYSQNSSAVVNVANNASIATGVNPTTSNGAGSTGIIAQSIGAGGGVVRDHLSNYDQSQTSLALAMGAVNGANGYSAAVNLNNNYLSTDSSNAVQTTGVASIGALAQSIGGGGGLGMLTEGTLGKGGSASLSFALGGGGSSYGDANGVVTVNSGGSITTAGDLSQGIIAQSIANGGGVAKAAISALSTGASFPSSEIPTAFVNNMYAAAYTDVGLAVGAKLGAASDRFGAYSDAVTVNSASSIATNGARSTGIVAQSISGGGGIIDIATRFLNTNDFTGKVTLGSSSSGSVGVTTVNSTGAIVTRGALADGILAQSIAFGGGSMGIIASGSSTAGSGAFPFQLGSYATNSDSYNAYNTTVSASQITTFGFGASGLTAQSIGGGGGLLAFNVNTGALGGTGTLGSMGSSGSNAQIVTVNTSGDIITNGASSHGVVAQSIGGGGGHVVGNQNVANIQLGGSSGGGNGGTVNISAANITTRGVGSYGIVAQSIGGGGGLVDLAGSNGQTSTLGGTAPGTGDVINISSGGTIKTIGNGSAAIIAQSIGGGGGLISNSSGVASFGSTNTSGMNAGAVNISVASPITTKGDVSPGVLAMSIGGRGGAIINYVSTIAQINTYKGTGIGGAVTVDVTSQITTTGQASYGVIAASLGGGGGLVLNTNGLTLYGAMGGGAAGEVKVNVTGSGSILVSGANSVGIYAGSSNGKNDPTVNIASGASVVGGTKGVGVYFAGDINNLNNSGYLGAVDGVNGQAVLSERGINTINNSGTSLGGISLGGGSNVINNLSGAHMYFLNRPNIGVDGVLNNSGFLQYNPKGFFALGTVIHQGTLIQSSAGVLGVKYDHHAAASDLIRIDPGSSMMLAGNIKPVLINAGLIAPGSATPTSFLSNSGGGLVVDQLGVLNTAIMSYNLLKSSSGVQLTSTANFTPAGLSAFGNQLGSAIGTFQTAGSNAFFQAATAQLVTIPTVGELDQAYTSLAGTAIQAMPQANYQAVTRAVGTVSDRMNSWRVGDSFIATTKNPRALMSGIASMNQPITPNAPQVANGTLSGDNTDGPIFLGKKSDARTWITPFGGTSNSNNLATQIYGGTLGVEAESDDRTFIGGAAVTVSQSNYTYSSTLTPATPGYATNYGAQFYFGARGESAYLSGIGYLGGSSGNFTRQLQALGFNTSAGVNVHSNILGARVEAGYNLLPNLDGKAPLQITPFVALQPTQIRQNGANETFGTFGSGFYYGANINTAVPLYLGTEISGEMAMGHNEVLKPFLRVSWAHDLMSPMTMNAGYTPTYGPTLYANGTPTMGNMVIVKGGAKYNWGTKVSAYATIDVEQGNAAYSYRGIGGSIGAIYSW